jgi:hypothetical protein
MEITSINFNDLMIYSRLTYNGVIRKPLAVSNKTIRVPRKLEGHFVLKKDIHLIKVLKKSLIGSDNQGVVKKLPMTPITVKHYNMSPFYLTAMRPAISRDSTRSPKRTKIKRLDLSKTATAFPQLTIYTARKYETIEKKPQTAKIKKKPLNSAHVSSFVCKSAFKRSDVRLKSLTKTTILNPW